MMIDRLSLLAGVVIAVAVAGCKDASRAGGPPPAPVVKVEPVVERDVPISAEWVGSLVGYVSAQIRARVSGHLMSQNYTEGAVVKAGDLLFQVDPRPYQAALDQAEANLLQAESQLSQAGAQVSASQAQVEQAIAKVAQAEANVLQAESQLIQARAQVSASQAQVEQAIAKVAQDEAQVKKAEADQRRTELDVGRYTPLAQRGSVSRQELDNAVQNNLANLAAVAAARAAVQNSQASVSNARAALEKAHADVKTQEANVAAARAAVQSSQAGVSNARAALEKARAEVKAQEANVAAARAALANAKLNLGYTGVLAPISGVAGFRVANIGDYVGPNDAQPLTTVSQVDPIYAQVPISEQRTLELFRRWDADPRAPRDTALELILADGSVYPRPGRAVAFDRQVDLTTGTVLARGVFPNPGNVLRPGQYAKVRAVVEVKKNALLIPQRAVQDVQGVAQVAVVRPDGTVDVRKVKTDARVGSLWVIAEGLNRGERVVVEGADRVRPGQKIRLESSASPDATTHK